MEGLLNWVACCATCDFYTGWYDNMFCQQHEDVEIKPFTICLDYVPTHLKDVVGVEMWEMITQRTWSARQLWALHVAMWDGKVTPFEYNTAIGKITAFFGLSMPHCIFRVASDKDKIPA